MPDVFRKIKESKRGNACIRTAFLSADPDGFGFFYAKRRTFMALSVTYGNRHGAGEGFPHTILSDDGGVCRVAVSVSRIFCDVLEFLYSGISYAVWPVSGGGSGSMGICPF